MNISYDGTTVTFKTEPRELFAAEKSGTKPNTVRILDIDEYHQLRKQNPKKIVIQYRQEIFLRTITNLHVTEGVFGKVIVVISWTNEEHTPTVEPGPHNVEPIPEVPTMPSISKCVACLKGMQEVMEHGPATGAPKSEEAGFYPPHIVSITITKDTHKLLQGIAHGRSINTVIRELYQTYSDKLAEERGAMHD